jgi:hypothetical protein
MPKRSIENLFRLLKRGRLQAPSATTPPARGADAVGLSFVPRSWTGAGQAPLPDSLFPDLGAAKEPRRPSAPPKTQEPPGKVVKFTARRPLPAAPPAPSNDDPGPSAA